MDLLDRLLGHDDWVTTRLLDLSRGLTDAQLDAPFEIGLGTLRATYEHIIFYVAFWTAYMTEQPVTEQRDERSMTALRERHERAFATFAALARQVRDEQRLEDTFVDHYAERMTFGGAILHVILHNAEHRSEAVHILGRLDVPDLPAPPEVDHGLWDFVRRGY